MNTKINVLRAVLARVARRALNLASGIAGAAFALLLAGTWALAHFFSAWWWLLLVLYVPLCVIGLIVILIGRFLTRRLAPPGLSRAHYEQLDAFVDKIQRLLETRGIGWPVFAAMNVKDLLLYRELRTTKALIADTSSLKRDFLELEETLQA